MMECCGCGACAGICPVQAIEMVADEEGFLYPKKDVAKCVQCGKCKLVCPATVDVDGNVSPKIYALRIKDTEVLRCSTSGGAFSLIADHVLKRGGIVCGVGFSEDFYVRHFCSENVESMRKSKYVQSDMKHIFDEIIGYLREGRMVLFSGTPCQCEAVKFFVGMRYADYESEKLVFVAVICHGVMSPQLWQQYVSYLQSKGGLHSYDFRSKYKSDNGHTVAYTLGEEECFVDMMEDRFLRMYLKNLNLRPSCYSCQYRSLECDFDFMLGDLFNFSAIDSVCGKFDDGRGASLVVANGKKAEQIIASFGDEAEIVYLGTARDKVLVPKAFPQKSILRKLFFCDLRKLKEGKIDMEFILKKYGA